MKTVLIHDVFSLAPLAQKWLAEGDGSFGIDMDVQTHLGDMQRLADGEDSGVLALLDGEDVIVGYMGIFRFANPIGRGFVANEHMLFVHPDHRGVGGIKLVRAAESWSQQHQCTHLILNASYLASSLCDRVCTLYERLGYRKFEQTFIKSTEPNGDVE